MIDVRRAPLRNALRAVALLGFIVACTAPTGGIEKICTPKTYTYCRCQDRTEGEHLCADDGRSFGPCEPCESYDDGPFDEAPFDAGRSDAGETPDGTCGNGTVEPGEDCDDANDDESDGCDSSCRLSGSKPSATNSCPGLDVHVWGPGHAPTLLSTTVGSGNRRVTPACGSTTGQTAPDRVFHVTAHASGTLAVAVTDATYNVFLWTAETCGLDENAQVGCVVGTPGATTATLTFPVEAGKSYPVFVDGAGSGSQFPREGAFRITLTIE